MSEEIEKRGRIYSALPESLYNVEIYRELLTTVPENESSIAGHAPDQLQKIFWET